MTDKTSWIEAIEPEHADQDLTAVYRAVRGPGGQLDNLYKALGLRPHILAAADALHRAILHDGRNSLPAWRGELVAAQVAILMGCEYAAAHHGHNFATAYDDPEQAAAILEALRAGQEPAGLEDREIAVLRYTAKLTSEPASMVGDDVAALRKADLSDGEILEINQISASFAYWVRVINGLGVTLGGERLGYDA